ncbi:zinc finger protein [Purpureocillium lavendulum]|uniref:Zinc finger protein n=1 Tax=Purpureocillium lavendulum TaxID=1247861 RepID=A0AB34FSM6_9HYPO|nr:zinc finger protein [Purpureocillium lavendulum]
MVMLGSPCLRADQSHPDFLKKKKEKKKKKNKARPNVVDFVQRFHKLQQQHETGDTLIRDLLVYCDRVETSLRLQNKKLSEELQMCKFNLTDTINERRDLLHQLQTQEANTNWLIDENKSLKVSHYSSWLAKRTPGADFGWHKFREQWTRQGFAGGKKAAHALREAIAEQCGDRADDIEIVCKVVTNMGGLGKALSRGGSVDSAADIRDFAAGFSHAYPSFDFVDVGGVPDGASVKLKDNTRWHLRNQNCKHILLGISHDASYAPFLEEILEDESTRQCITVIEGVPVAHELAVTDVKVMDIGRSLFRCEHPGNTSSTSSHSSNSSGNSLYPAWTSGGTRTTSPATSVSSSNLTPGSSSSSNGNSTGTNSIANNNSSSSNSSNSMSYATVTCSGTPPPQITVPIPPKAFNAVTRPKVQYTQMPSPQPDWNPGRRGLDEPITVSVAALETIKKRRDQDKLCNNHFLRGPCTKGDACLFSHSYRPTADEVKAIAVLARQNPCTAAQDCDMAECIYGHHCPSVKDGVCCHPFCKFSEEAHPPGTKFRNCHIKSNN